MEVGGATLGLAAIDFVGVVQGLAVVGGQRQVTGQGLAALAQGLGQVALQGAVEAPRQLGEGRQGGQEGVMHGGVGGGIAQGGAGVGQRGDAGGGVEQDGPQDASRTLGAVVGQADVLLAQRLSADVNGAGGDGILRWSHGSLLV